MVTESFVLSLAESVWLPSRREKTLAWIAHAFTATGALWALLAVLAISNRLWLEAFMWMGAAVVVDAFDGMAARRMRVKAVLPEFDGALLDNILDYLNYVFVPAYFLLQSDVLPGPLRAAGAALILLVSAYQFCQSDAKTEDYYFKGFPSYWNIVVFYMFVLNLAPWLNLALVVVLSILVFVPIKYVYPSRAVTHRRLTMALACMWGLITVGLFAQYPTPNLWLVGASLLYVAYYFGLSLYATRRTAAQGEGEPDIPGDM